VLCAAGFYEDFARVADDEARHFGWCVQRLAELGHRYSRESDFASTNYPMILTGCYMFERWGTGTGHSTLLQLGHQKSARSTSAYSLQLCPALHQRRSWLDPVCEHTLYAIGFGFKLAACGTSFV
jgi:transcriptional regulator of aromatic amino acid metabolism